MTAKLTLFDNTERTDAGPAAYAEPSFPYWNRSARKDLSRVRDELEKWFGNYPAKHAADLRARFRSPNDVQHRGAFFELFLYEMLRRLECEVEVHPSLAGTKKRPEFHVRWPAGEEFYIEARVAGDESLEQAGGRVRVNLVYDAINDLESPDYWINVEPRSTPSSLVRTKKLKEFLRKQLAALDYDDIRQRYERSGFDELPRWEYASEGWSAELFPIPKGKARGQGGLRPLGLQMIPVHWIDSVTPLRAAILEKAKKYGKPELPFVIAINFVGEHIDEIDEVCALFGDEVWIVRSPNGPAEPCRKPNGVWTNRDGQYRRVSGVLIFRQLQAWNFPRTPLHVYLHPDAHKPLTSALTQLPHEVVVNGRIESRKGSTLAEVFGISPDWLEDLQ